MSSKPKTALITGAAQGIGRATAEVLLGRGLAVVLADRDGEGAAKAAAELDTAGGRAHSRQLDVRDLDAVAAIAEELERDLGGVDVLVNNAGITHLRTLWEISPEEWEELFEINLRSVFFLSRAVAGGMKSRGWGRIVNLTSVAGMAPRSSGAHYGASKAGVISLTRAFALELGPSGITVNAVAPGLVDTAMASVIPPEMRERQIAEQIPVRRSSGPEEVAWLIGTLSSEEAGFITGATYDINGGVMMR